MALIAWVDDTAYKCGPLLVNLEQLGHKVVTYSTLVAAVGSIEEIRSADVMLIEPTIPPGRESIGSDLASGMDFLNFFEAMGGMPPTIILTVANIKKLEEDAQLLGVRCCFRKPVLPSVLKRVVEEILAER